MLKRLRTSSIALSAAALVSAFGAVALSAGPAAADGPHYYVTVGGTCDGPGHVYDGIDLRGGVRLNVGYPAGAAGLPNCNQTPMDRSVEIGEANAKQVILDNWDPSATYTLVGYSQGAIVVNKVLEDIADGNVAVDKENFNAKLYADPMAPVGPPGIGIGAVIPKGWGLPSPFGGYVSPGKGRTDFNGIEYVRYCIETDGVCDFNDIQGPGGYLAQHTCYRWTDPNGNDLMADSMADGFFNNGPVSIPKKDCWGALPTI
ncbi:MAG: PE-PPE domain-containing protein [Actinomycetia bacterium]|nr:PE-PPE domain-containing protein [Actinomycetes bacterium]